MFGLPGWALVAPSWLEASLSNYLQPLISTLSTVATWPYTGLPGALSNHEYWLKFGCCFEKRSGWNRTNRTGGYAPAHAVVSAGLLLFLIYFDAITQIPLSLGSFMDIMLIISFCIAIKEHIQLDIDEVSDWVDGNHLWHSLLLRVKWWSSHAGECTLPLK